MVVYVTIFLKFHKFVIFELPIILLFKWRHFWLDTPLPHVMKCHVSADPLPPFEGMTSYVNGPIEERLSISMQLLNQPPNFLNVQNFHCNLYQPFQLSKVMGMFMSVLSGFSLLFLGRYQVTNIQDNFRNIHWCARNIAECLRWGQLTF